ncbi:hypothetical protein F5X68DRAFT_134495 [Plectosphaerella plurivora]|uniref:Uncharacterized protein n=1 Tax=Plectosphaerella plurivora TaxID=936078 RepID=A0A9P9ABM4_9PEZI|nr:hypothetical protein F5X68DRAFT_134495 [Plectosphaerella plurivora]
MGQPLSQEKGGELEPHLRPVDSTSLPPPTLNQTSSTLEQQTPAKPGSICKRKLCLLCVFYLLGLATTLCHVAYYIHLDGTIVGNSYVQQKNIRVGTALAVLTQFSFVTAVWLSYTQTLWLHIRQTALSPDALDAAFGANESILFVRNLEMLRKFKKGTILALLAWCLLLPAFFTPATLFVKPGTWAHDNIRSVPQLVISDPSEGHRFAYSPPTERNASRLRADNETGSRRRTFAGPRTTLSLASTAAASVGEILPIAAPRGKSSYNVSFFGPAVQCSPANLTTAALMDIFLREKMARQYGAAREVDNAYYAFVPVWGENGTVQPVAKPRERGPSNATNEVWISFSKYVDSEDHESGEHRMRRRENIVCELYNATYDVSFNWVEGVQRIAGNTSWGDRVSFPTNAEAQRDPDPSDMARHAYAAFMWVITDQVVGSMSWYEDSSKGQDESAQYGSVLVDSDLLSDDKSNSGTDRSDGNLARPINTMTEPADTPTSPAPAQFGVIDTPLEHNVPLGCDDLDVFFDFSRRLYNFDDSRMAGLKDQRRRDKSLAGGLSFGRLIEQLSFNVTVSLFQNDLLTRPVNAMVTTVDDVNRYGYIPLGLFLPYSLANFATLSAVIWGCYLLLRHGPMPGKSFSDVAKATLDPEVGPVLRGRHGMLKAFHEEQGMSLRKTE